MQILYNLRKKYEPILFKFSVKKIGSISKSYKLILAVKLRNK